MGIQETKTSKITLSAMMMCIIIVSILILRIPIPFTQGYVNLSDAMVFMSVMILGRKYGVASAGIGSALGDVIGGFALWAPWTFVIKGGMALIFGVALTIANKGDRKAGAMIAIGTVGMAIGVAFMNAGYFVAEGIMYGNWPVAALGIPWNACQGAVGIVLALAISLALGKTSFKKFFTYTWEGKK